ncbi:MAG: hypothetical protein WBF87_07600, partial [Mesorhizobium sp.]
MSEASFCPRIKAEAKAETEIPAPVYRPFHLGINRPEAACCFRPLFCETFANPPLAAYQGTVCDLPA